MSEAGLARASDVTNGLDELEQLTREIQDSVMAIRAQPVKSVFQRMPRLAREVAAITGKSVRLTTEGENTEVDKTRSAAAFRFAQSPGRARLSP